MDVSYISIDESVIIGDYLRQLLNARVEAHIHENLANKFGGNTVDDADDSQCPTNVPLRHREKARNTIVQKLCDEVSNTSGKEITPKIIGQILSGHWNGEKSRCFLGVVLAWFGYHVDGPEGEKAWARLREDTELPPARLETDPPLSDTQEMERTKALIRRRKEIDKERALEKNSTPVVDVRVRTSHLGKGNQSPRSW